MDTPEALIKRDTGYYFFDDKLGRERLCCGAKTKAGFCKRYPVKGRMRCPRHGGKSLSGPEHHWFKNGKYSQVLRRDLLFDYVASLESETLYSQDDELAIYDARLKQLQRQINKSREWDLMLHDLQTLSSELWIVVNQAQEEESEGLDDETKARLRDIQASLNQMMLEIVQEKRQWEEFYFVTEARRKLIESERKRELDSQRMMTEQQAQVLLSVLINAVRKHVPEPHVRDAIAAELVQLSARPTGRQLTG